MKKVLITGPFNEVQRQEMRSVSEAIECLFCNTSEVTMDIIKDIHAVIGNLPLHLLENTKNLEWIQLTSSGADAYLQSDKLDREILMTSATGGYGVGIAEYMVAMLLVMMKKIPAYLENQKNEIWKDEGKVTTPFGKRILIIGTGNIGIEFAKRMRPFGGTLVGIRRRTSNCPEEFDEMYSMEELRSELSKADVIALCLPGTKETYHLFSDEILKCCKEGAYLLNVGRGNVISMNSLLKEEIYNRFAGIWLDVCETEPLPNGHSLFNVPNLLITPHITGGFHLDLTVDTIYDICLHNLKAWVTGGEYRSVLDRDTGYCK